MLVYFSGFSVQDFCRTSPASGKDQLKNRYCVSKKSCPNFYNNLYIKGVKPSWTHSTQVVPCIPSNVHISVFTKNYYHSLAINEEIEIILVATVEQLFLIRFFIYNFVVRSGSRT